MFALPNNIAVDLLERLNALEVDTTQELGTIKAEAEALKNRDLLNGSMVFGVIACLENDLERMHRYHLEAIRLSTRAMYPLYNYSVSLGKRGLFSSSLSFAIEALTWDSKSPLILDQIISMTYLLGLKTQFKEYLARWDKLFPEKKNILAQKDVYEQPELVRPEVADRLEKNLKEKAPLWERLASL